MSSHIIAIGGGGFLSGTAPELDAYVLRQARREKPHIGFIGAASGNSSEHLQRFHERFSAFDCRPSHLDFFGRTPDIGSWIRSKDVIYVGGGNTKTLLAIWREWGVVEHLQQALRDGVVLAGVSAGAICWFEYGITDSFAAGMSAIQGLGILPGSCCPHYSSEPERPPLFEKLIASQAIPAGIAIDDGVAVHFIDGLPRQVLSAQAGHHAHRVASSGPGLPVHSTRIAP